MRVRTLIAALVLLLVAAGTGTACALHVASTTRLDSGLAGRVSYGPTCPVQRAGQSCTRPYRAELSIRNARTRALVARVRSSWQGRFRLPLAPGRYLIVPQVGRPYPTAFAQTATVGRHRYTYVTIHYDSGIR